MAFLHISRSSKSVTVYDPRAWVTPDDLNVVPSLLGMPLATPLQRALAMGTDLALIAVLSNIGNSWLLGAGALALWLWLKRRGEAAPARKPVAWLAVGVFLVLGGLQAWGGVSGGFGDDDDDEDRPRISKVKPAALAKADDDVKLQRIHELEAALKKATEPKPAVFDPKTEVQRLLRKVGLSYIWALAYFSLVPVLWQGQTLGKRLFGSRVVELTGKPLTPMICFKRYGGYAAGMATGMFGFAQVFWDSNRQAIQDKTAHTVVVNTRSHARLPIPAAEPAPMPEPTAVPVTVPDDEPA